MRLPQQDDLTNLWMVPYADLMTTLVILFLGLFALSYGDRPPEFEAAVSKLQEDVSAPMEADLTHKRRREAELAVKLKAVMNGLELKDFGINVTERAVRIVLPSPVLFAESSAALSPGAARVLEALAGLVGQFDNPVLVEGHTDNVPFAPVAGDPHRNNWELSAARAFSVIEFFIGRGMKPVRFHARGYGEQRPAAPNDTAAGRGRNRRIEISLMREMKEELPVP